ncbi:MAG TPA: hypothetical protein PLO27_03280, partial [Marmoricola sp.]|nr:hypothetical protein [Marmoricola sp.]
ARPPEDILIGIGQPERMDRRSVEDIAELRRAALRNRLGGPMEPLRVMLQFEWRWIRLVPSSGFDPSCFALAVG